MKIVTLGFLLEGNQILLALKKRGFGKGNMNGIGGHLEVGETPEEAMVREAMEEIRVEVLEKNLEKVAEIEFHFENRPEWDLLCHTFFIRTWKGKPEETDEMAPEWFPQNQIPFNKMWADDKFWLPRALSGEKLQANFLFSYDGREVKKYIVEKVEKF